jgi:hypothetical protein
VDDPVALGTFVIAFFTVVLAGVACIQIRFLVRADGTAERAANASKVAADAAKDSAEATKATVLKMHEIAERQLRAYVNISSATIFAGDEVDMVNTTIQNFGQTPAYKCRTHGEVRVGPYPPSAEIIEPVVLLPDHSASTLGPGSSAAKTTDVTGLTAREKEHVAGGLSGIFLIGRVEYEDVFGTPRFTNYRMVCRGINFERGLLSFEPEGNDCN